MQRSSMAVAKASRNTGGMDGIYPQLCPRETLREAEIHNSQKPPFQHLFTRYIKLSTSQMNKYFKSRIHVRALCNVCSKHVHPPPIRPVYPFRQLLPPRPVHVQPHAVVVPFRSPVLGVLSPVRMLLVLHNSVCSTTAWCSPSDRVLRRSWKR